MSPSPAPILEPVELDLLSVALSDFTSEQVHEVLGLVGRAAQERGDVAGALRELPADDRLGTLVRLFLLGVEVPAAQARDALQPLALDAAAELVAVDGDRARARMEIRPYSADDSSPWWVVSDFGSDVRPGPLTDDHVLGIGGASLTLAQSTIRTPVARALDIGTGSGVQALHLSRHCRHVMATDLSGRALRLAATTAALSGVTWELRQGSLLEPIGDEKFDLIVANPPFVVSPGFARGTGGHDYRDSGLAGDGVCRELLSGIPDRLVDGGTASMLANWIIPPDGDWASRVSGWLDGRGCDAWIWQREVLSAGEYVALWLRDAGEVPGTASWLERYETWVRWFSDNEIPAVGMGLVTLWRPPGTEAVRIVCEDVRQAVEQPAGAHLPEWIGRQRWLSAVSDRELLATRLRPPPDLIRASFDLHGSGTDAPSGWFSARTELRQSHGMRWELETDEAIAALVGACTGQVRLDVAIALLSAGVGADVDEVTEAVLPVVRDLVARGFLDRVDGP